MPFSKANSGEQKLEKKDLNYIFNSFIKKAVESFKIDEKPYFDEVTRFDQSIGSIINGIVENLNSSDLVIADLTGNNPNVMYELGVRHSLKRGTIMLTQDFNSFPSDLRDYLAIEYKYPSSPSDYNDCYKAFETKLHGAIQQVLNSKKHDSPVLELLNYKMKFRDQDEIDNLKEQIVILNSFYADLIDLNQLIVEHYEENQKFKKKQNKAIFELIGIFLNSLISKLDLLDFNVSENNLLVDIGMTINFLSDVDRSLHMDNIPQSLLNIPVVEDIFNSSNVKDILDKEFIDPVYLRKKREIRKAKFRYAFSNDEFVMKNIFEEAIEIIGNSAERLGAQEEIKSLIRDSNPRK